MAITVRLDKDTEKTLDRLAREHRLSRSELVRRGIRLLASQPATGEVNPYEEIRHLIGSARGGPRDLSERTGEAFQKALLDRPKRR